MIAATAATVNLESLRAIVLDWPRLPAILDFLHRNCSPNQDTVQSFQFDERRSVT
jgi:hypothetical protein